MYYVWKFHTYKTIKDVSYPTQYMSATYQNLIKKFQKNIIGMQPFTAQLHI